MLGEASSSLAPGFRFHPTDEELVSYYLKRKVSGRSFKVDAISVIDIYKSEPWDLPDKSRLKSRDLEWYFFSALDKKYGNGWRTNRATDQGYWKTTGKDREIKRGSKVVGMKKTLVYHIGRAPRGERTNWVMHEYRLVDEDLAQSGVAQDAFVLCRIFQKSGTGPKNGEQYGAPFVEEEWDEDEEVKVTEACDVLEEESLQQHYSEQNLPLEAQPLNVELPVGPDGGDGLNNAEEQMGFAKDGQNIFIGSGETDFAPERPHEQFFESPEQFQMEDYTAVKNECFDFDELLNSVGGGDLADESVSGNLAQYDGPSDPPVVNESFIEMDDFENPVKADPSGFEMLDEYLTYFDATEDILNNGAFEYPTFDYHTTPEANDPNLNFSEAYQSSLLPCKMHGDEGASSSEEKPENEKVASPDAQFDGWDSTLAKQVSRMLGSIPAPAAFAAEFPKKAITLGQNSTESSSSIHVTAGMIHISSMTVDGSGKSGDVDFILPYSFTRGNIMSVESLIRSSFEPTASFSGKAGVMARSTVYLIFLWVLILSVTYKVGSAIYLR